MFVILKCIILEQPCELYCSPSYDENKIQKMKDYVIDGTPCLSGTNNMCVDGECRVSYIQEIKYYFGIFIIN